MHWLELFHSFLTSDTLFSSLGTLHPFLGCICLQNYVWGRFGLWSGRCWILNCLSTMQALPWLRDSVSFWIANSFLNVEICCCCRYETEVVLRGLLEWWKLMFLTILAKLTGLFLAFVTLMVICYTSLHNGYF